MSDFKYLELNKNETGYEFVKRKNATGVIAIIAETIDGELLLGRQYRPPVKAYVLDIPAGLVGDEGPEQSREAAIRELLEETGYEHESINSLGKFPSSPGMSAELTEIFFAQDCRFVQKPEDGIELLTIRVEYLDNWLRAEIENKRLVDPKVFIALSILTDGAWKLQ